MLFLKTKIDVLKVMKFTDIFIIILAYQSSAQIYNDPQWHTGNMWQYQLGSNMKLVETWNKGYSGKGVKIAILDDGVDLQITELRPNAVTDLSWDYERNTANPEPKFSNMHGTHVASVAAGVRNNTVCGFGVAPGAGIVGVRLFVDVVVRGSSLPSNILIAGLIGSVNGKQRHLFTDIFVRSWGFSDTGTAADGPDESVIAAERTVAYQGRHGRGGLIVISSGNGGSKDDCSYDGYVQSPYAVAVQAVSQTGSKPSYTEYCSAALTSVFVGSGIPASNPTFNSVLPEECKTNFGGTSAAAPMVAGAMALALEANPTLSRRDLLGLVVEASKPDALDPSVQWLVNSAGLRYNAYFGFGLLNVQDLVDSASKALSSKSASFAECSVSGTPSTNTQDAISFNLAACTVNVVSLEYISVQFDMQADKRGDVEFFLSAPSGSKIQLVARRPLDTGTSLNDWNVVTPFFWGESLGGANVGHTWLLEYKPSSVQMTNVLIKAFGEHPISFYKTSTTAAGGCLKGTFFLMLPLFFGF